MLGEPDLEARVTPKIAGAFQAALEKIGRDEFLAMARIDDQRMRNVLRAAAGGRAGDHAQGRVVTVDPVADH